MLDSRRQGQGWSYPKYRIHHHTGQPHSPLLPMQGSRPTAVRRTSTLSHGTVNLRYRRTKASREYIGQVSSSPPSQRDGRIPSATWPSTHDTDAPSHSTTSAATSTQSPPHSSPLLSLLDLSAPSGLPVKTVTRKTSKENRDSVPRDSSTSDNLK